jgi:hypothetical protein
MSLRSEVIRIVNELLGNSKKITELPAGTAPTGAELIEGVQGGVNVKFTVSQLGGGGGAITDGQGTTANGTAVDLGGDISTAVALNLEPGGSFSVSPASLPALSIDIGSSGAFMRTTDVTFSFNSDGTVVFNDSRATPVGIEYASDYSATFTDRSLVDKEYVDNAAGAGAPKVVQLAASDETSSLTTGTDKITFRMPYAMTLTSVRASLTTPQYSGNIITVDINQSGSSVLSTKLTIDNGEDTSVGAAVAPVISTSALTDDAEITIDIDQVGDGSATGLKITLIGT